MGFLDIYSGTTKVDVGNNFYIEIKKHLSNAEYTTAQKALIKDQRMDTTAGLTAQIDTAAYQLAIMKKAIVGWNLTGHNDEPIAVTDDTISALPQIVFNKVYQAIEASEEEAGPAEQANFPVKS